jgi:hypothetical protein
MWGISVKHKQLELNLSSQEACLSIHSSKHSSQRKPKLPDLKAQFGLRTATIFRLLNRLTLPFISFWANGTEMT